MANITVKRLAHLTTQDGKHFDLKPGVVNVIPDQYADNAFIVALIADNNATGPAPSLPITPQQTAGAARAF